MCLLASCEIDTQIETERTNEGHIFCQPTSVICVKNRLCKEKTRTVITCKIHGNLFSLLLRVILSVSLSLCTRSIFPTNCD